MSGPRAVADLLAAWARGLTIDEHQSLDVLCIAIAEAIRRAQKVPQLIDRRCMALVVTKLEEAEHWALQAVRLAVDREDTRRDQVDDDELEAERREQQRDCGDAGEWDGPGVRR